ncbi:MAG: class I SAM-dependent methyltransferase [Chitinophagales bacterium]|nr:class I SAM-dependent methyltransferase [Chitinophagales bacterium]
MPAADILLNEKKYVPSAFDNIARRYDLATWFSRNYQTDLFRSVEKVSDIPAKRILDLCCGTGKSTLAIKKFFPEAEITAVDNSPEMLKVAEEKEELRGVKFVQADAMELDFPDAHFDIIFMAYGIRNMPDPVKCLNNLKRMLRPGGAICFHEYILSDGWWPRIYWSILGYGFILPFCSVLTGDFSIFRYLIHSVLNFFKLSDFCKTLQRKGFYEVKWYVLPGWRAPILKTVVAVK